MLPRRLISFAVFVYLASAFAFPVEAAPLLVLEERAVRLEGLAPFGSAVVFAVTRPDLGPMASVERLEAVVEADAAGVAVWELASAPPLRSVWVAVDLASGEYDLAAPAEWGLRLVDFPSRGIGATRRSLADERRFLEVLLVRPTSAVPTNQVSELVAGAWGLTYGDGSERDADGRLDGRVEALLDLLQAVGSSPVAPPQELAPGDVVVVVDPTTFEIYAAKLAA